MAHTSSPSKGSLTTPLFFTAATLAALNLTSWASRWLLSGAPLLQLIILLGSANGARVLPTLHLWPLFTTLNMVYAVSSTSWLLYGAFAAACYPAILVTCVFQFTLVSDVARRAMRKLVRKLHFIDDMIAFFDIPALEIDTEVDGLMALRGITFSISTLSFVVHGVEVGIKLSDDMEMAIQTERVEVKLFRGIWVGDCFANLKGGKYEMTFGDIDDSTRDVDGDAVFVEDTPLLKAASRASSEWDNSVADGASDRFVKFKDEATGGRRLESSSVEEGLKSVVKLSPDDEIATGRYQEMLASIKDTSMVEESRLLIKAHAEKVNHGDENAFRAAICSNMHSKPSVPNAPRRSIKVTTLQTLMPAYVRHFLHRLPLLLRALLNPLAYFHPVNIASITASASGKWIDSMLVDKIFEDYGDNDKEIRSLKNSLSKWLSDANFVTELGSIIGLAQVPFTPSYDINCRLVVENLMAFRTRPKKLSLNRVVQLGGADAAFVVPYMLMPHHEHLLPTLPTASDKEILQQGVDRADDGPKTLQKQREMDIALQDQTKVGISVHARLPAIFSQDLLDFIASLVKATKVVEIEKGPHAMDEEVHGLKQFGGAIKGGLKESAKKVIVDSVVNEKWIAKMVGKITRKLEKAQGDVGYSGDIPVPLRKYRTMWAGEGDKLLP